MLGYMPAKQEIMTHGNRSGRNPLFSRFAKILLCCLLLLAHSPWTHAEQPSEYRLKVAFLYNFIAFTEWPDMQGKNLNFCIYGEDPFGENLQHLRDKKFNEHSILIHHTKNIEDLFTCQVVFLSQSIIHNLNDILNQLSNKPILTVSDSPNTSLQGVVINMSIKEGKVTFEANIASAKRNGLKLSSQLLRFASEVYQ